MDLNMIGRLLLRLEAGHDGQARLEQPGPASFNTDSLLTPLAFWHSKALFRTTATQICILVLPFLALLPGKYYSTYFLVMFDI